MGASYKQDRKGNSKALRSWGRLLTAMVMVGRVALATAQDVPVADCNANGLDDADETQPLRLRAGLEFPVVKYAWDSVAADFDGDGDLDLIFNDAGFSGDSSYRPPGAVLVRNDGHGRFAPPETIGMGGDRLAVADFNGDGRLDLAVSHSRQVSVVYRTQDGWSATRDVFAVEGSISSIQGADLDGDGTADLIVGGNRAEVRWAAQLDGKLRPFTPIPGVMGSAQATDFDGDGDADLLLNAASQVAMNRGDGSFEPPQALFPPQDGLSAFEALAADFNTDGRMDLATVHLPRTGGASAGILQVVLDDGQGGYAQAFTGPVPGDTGVGIPAQRRFVLAAGDLDGDGDLEIAVASSRSPLVGLLRNGGDGRFDVVETHYASEALTKAGLWFEDFDLDGHIDLGVGGSSFVLLSNDGTGGLMSATQILEEGFTQTVVADFDGDGLRDLVVGANPLYLFRNLGERRFAEPQRIDFTSSVDLVLDLDVDGDSRAELLLGRPERREIEVWRADEAFRFSTSEIVPGVPHAIATAQLDADGRGDLLGIVDGHLVPYFHRVDGWTRGEPLATLPADGSRVLPLDLDTDGIEEIVVNASIPGKLLIIHDATNPTATTYVDAAHPPLGGFNVVSSQSWIPFRDDPHGGPSLWSLDRRVANGPAGEGIVDVVSIFPNEGGTLVGPPSLLHWGALGNLRRRALASGDLNLDGRDDLVAGSSVLLHLEPGRRPTTMRFAVPSATGNSVFSEATVSDIDGDARPDVLMRQFVGSRDDPYGFQSGVWILWNESAPATSEDCNLNRIPDACELALGDCDGDGTPDACQSDFDDDGRIDACDDDADGDLVGADEDACPFDPRKLDPEVCGCGEVEDTLNADRDGIPWCIDVCPTAPDLAQSDLDGDGFGDACDRCPLDARKVEPELCGCGRLNSLADSDADTVYDCVDACPGVDDRRDSNNNDVADCADLCHPLNGGAIAAEARGDGNCDGRRTAPDLSAVVATMASNVRSACGGEDVVADCRATEVDLQGMIRLLFGS